MIDHLLPQKVRVLFDYDQNAKAHFFVAKSKWFNSVKGEVLDIFDALKKSKHLKLPQCFFDQWLSSETLDEYDRAVIKKDFVKHFPVKDGKMLKSNII